jgi:hypothetical protein
MFASSSSSVVARPRVAVDANQRKRFSQRIRCAAASSSATSPAPTPTPISPDAVERAASIPYKDGSIDKTVYINDAAREAIEKANAGRFVSIIDPSSPKLAKLLSVIDDGWDAIGVKNKNAGHHTLWPEAFEAGKALLEEAFPEECSPEFGGEVLNGVAFVNEPKYYNRAIDFMQRRTKEDFIMSKYNPLGRLHRDPDAIDYKSPGWMEAGMESSDEYSYRYYNVWLLRSPRDPTGQAWDKPLVVLLPRNGGAKEWTYDVRRPEDNVEDDSKKTTGSQLMSTLEKIKANPMSAAPMVMQAFSTKKKEDKFEAQDSNYMTRGSPELQPSDEHVWITAPYMIFDSFDMWHGAGTWMPEDKRDLRNGAEDAIAARKDAIKGRVSIELRFRARCKPKSREGVPFSPVSAAYRGGAFKPETVRPSDGEYDLENGTVIV